MKKLVIIFLAALIYAGCNNKDAGMYSVTFDAKGGSPTPPKQTVEPGGTATAPTEKPSKKDYVFRFWSLENAATAYNFQTPVTGNIKLIANWQEESKLGTLRFTLAGSGYSNIYITGPARYNIPITSGTYTVNVTPGTYQIYYRWMSNSFGPSSFIISSGQTREITLSSNSFRIN